MVDPLVALRVSVIVSGWEMILGSESVVVAEEGEEGDNDNDDEFVFLPSIASETKIWTSPVVLPSLVPLPLLC